MTMELTPHALLADNGVAVEPSAPAHPPLRAPAGVAGVAGVDGSSPQSPSLQDLIDAWQEPGRPKYADLLQEFKRANNCTVKETYFAQHVSAGVILVNESLERGSDHAGDTLRDRLLRRRSPSTRTNIWLSYNSGVVPSRFAYVVMTLRRHQREGSILLTGRSQDILDQNIYTTLSYLLNVLDSISAPRDAGSEASARALTEQSRDRMKAAIDSADEECRKIAQKLQECVTKRALTGYLVGLLAGLVPVAFLVAFVARSSFNVGHLASNSVLAICLATGAIGALLSVMARITSGEQLRVRPDLGSVVTILAGSFRPMVGAVFGAVLYVLILGGLLPMAVPLAAEKADVNLFFAGIAFLAGFSERWAQDTIVHSVPKGGPSTMKDSAMKDSASMRDSATKDAGGPKPAN